MPAKSQAQQRLFGMVHAYQKGKLKHPPKKIKEVAEHISDEDAEHFAKTKHDGLPEKKGFDLSSIISKLSKMASKKEERAFEGDGEVVSFTPDKTKDHDEIVFRDSKDGQLYRISNNTTLGKRLNAKIGDKIRAHGKKIKGTNVVHKVHMNMHAPGGWLEKLPPEEKAAAATKVVVRSQDEEQEFGSIAEAASYIAGKTGYAISKIKELLSQRETQIGNLSIEYPDPSSEETDSVQDLGTMFQSLTGSYGPSSYYG